MKKICLFMMMLIFPLQAALASLEAYHGQQSDHDSTAEYILHQHDELTKSKVSHTKHCEKTQSNCENDHHFCPSVSVFTPPLLVEQLFPELSTLKHSTWTEQYESRLVNRIERPKWVS
jgi:hypothetical protein